MTLYLYRIGESVPLLTFENAISYTDNEVVLQSGAVCAPLATDCELSETPDCTGTLRADWRRDHCSTEDRIEALEALMAEILFGGETV